MNLYVTRNEAIEREIRDALRPGLAGFDGPVEDYYDIDAIADETITMFIAGGGMVTYCLSADIYPAMFWEIVDRHTR